MIVLDMDGTLLTDNLIIPEKTYNILNYLHQQGILIVFATARVYQSALRYAELFSFNIPLITANGSIIKDSKGMKTYLTRKIPYYLALKIINRARNMGLYYKVYIDSVLYVEKLTEEATIFANQHQINLKVEENILNISAGKGSEMIVVLEKHDKIDSFIANNKGLLTRVSWTKSEANSLEINSAGTSKGKAVEILSNKMQIKRQEIIAFGNNLNDLSMIKYAGLSIAMDNSPLLLKEAADCVTLSNNAEGVLYMLKTLFNI
jgi:Cof subfamily protein (haloacid dehalogenase superfamily)